MLIEIQKISPEHPISPEDPNQAQLQLENSGDIAGDIDSISPDISPAANSQNHAQNRSSGDTGYTGDTIHTIQSDKQEDNCSKKVYRLGHSDTLACKDCKQTGDIHYMKQHNCRGLR
jgi:hypothetical protein